MRCLRQTLRSNATLEADNTAVSCVLDAPQGENLRIKKNCTAALFCITRRIMIFAIKKPHENMGFDVLLAEWTSVVRRTQGASSCLTLSAHTLIDQQLARFCCLTLTHVASCNTISLDG